MGDKLNQYIAKQDAKLASKTAMNAEKERARAAKYKAKLDFKRDMMNLRAGRDTAVAAMTAEVMQAATPATEAQASPQAAQASPQAAAADYTQPTGAGLPDATKASDVSTARASAVRALEQSAGTSSDSEGYGEEAAQTSTAEEDWGGAIPQDAELAPYEDNEYTETRDNSSLEGNPMNITPSLARFMTKLKKRDPAFFPYVVEALDRQDLNSDGEGLGDVTAAPTWGDSFSTVLTTAGNLYLQDRAAKRESKAASQALIQQSQANARALYAQDNTAQLKTDLTPLIYVAIAGLAAYFIFKKK